MKKIVSMLAAVAMAASLFAVDVAAHIQLDGSILAKSGDGVSAMTLKKLDPTQDQPNFTMSVGGDVAGAQLMNYAGTDAHDVIDSSFVEWNIWFKPFDALKVTLGTYEYKLNNPHFGWWASLIDFPDYGYAFDFNAGAFSATLALGQYNANVWSGDPWNWAYGNAWFDSTRSSDGYGKIGNFEAIIGYDLGGAGNIKAVVAKGAKVCPHGFSINSAWCRTSMVFGLGYSNQPWAQTGYFADFAFVMDANNKPLEADAQLYFEYHNGALAAYLVDCAGINMADNGKDKFKDGFELKVEYALGAVTPYLQVLGYDVMDGKIEFHPGVAGSFGACGYWVEVAVTADNGTIGWSVPVQFTIGF